MTDGYAPGAPGPGRAAGRALGGLVRAATVRIQRTGAGYAHDEVGTFLGSGFFVAPSWVLTCAHVAYRGEGGEVTVVFESARGRGTRAVTGRTRSVLPVDGHFAAGDWPAPDLALVQLTEPADHECVYVSEHPDAYGNHGEVLYAGWTVVADRLVYIDGPLVVEGTLGSTAESSQIRLGGNDLPEGVSGGPVVVPGRGEVVGVLKARTTQARAGTATGVEQLRRLPVPTSLEAEHTDPYQAVFHAHDRYHRDRQRNPAPGQQTWVDVQTHPGAGAGPALTPGEKAELLGTLAELPPPASTGSLLDILQKRVTFPVHLAHAAGLAPRGWRDGLGFLHQHVREGAELPAVVAYVLDVLSAERPFRTPGTLVAEGALRDWVRGAARRLDFGSRHMIAHEWDARQRGAPDGHLAEGRGPGGEAGPQPSVLVELVRRGWEPDRCDWSVSVAPGEGEVVRLYEGERAPLDELPAVMASALAEAFRRCDRPGRPALLQAAVPHLLLDREVDAWRLGPDQPPLGTQRPVVLRCSDRDQLAGDTFEDPDPYDVDQERRARWRWLHAHRATAEVLDCGGGWGKRVPAVEQLRGLSHSTVPVLCRFGDRAYEDDTEVLARIVRGGYGVALWRRRGGNAHAGCGEFHRGTLDEIAGPPSAHRLPEAVHHLRVRLRSGRPETYWADGIALLYDDPHQPLPRGDALRAP